MDWRVFFLTAGLFLLVTGLVILIQGGFEYGQGNGNIVAVTGLAARIAGTSVCAAGAILLITITYTGTPFAIVTAIIAAGIAGAGMMTSISLHNRQMRNANSEKNKPDNHV